MSGPEIKRRHHYLSRFFLEGFVPPGEPHLHVWDLEAQKGWRAAPEEAAHQRDLYRPTAAFPHPNFFEDAFAEVEGQLAPSLRRVIRRQKIDDPVDLSRILHLVALNAARPPGEMSDFESIVDVLARKAFVEEATPDMHERALGRMQAEGRATDLVGDFEAWKKSIAKGEVKLVLTHDARLTFGVLLRAEEILEILVRRRWTLLRAGPDGPTFFCSDRPVALLNNRNDVEGVEARFDHEALDVIMPLSRGLALVGGYENRAGPAQVGSGAVRFVNHVTRGGADRFLFGGPEVADGPVEVTQPDGWAFRRAVYPHLG